jgi:hypothetical protein
MTQTQRNWMIEAITNCFPLVVFQHEQEKLEIMIAKYADPNTIISEWEIDEDVIYLDNIYGE